MPRCLQKETLYPDEWKKFGNRGFLDWDPLVVATAGMAFVLAVVFIAKS